MQMRVLLLSAIVGLATIGCDAPSRGDPQAELAAATNEADRFYALGPAAKRSFAAGAIDTARSNAEELLVLAPKFRGNWNYGNAIHDGNMILGRVAAKSGKVEEAAQFLRAAGRTPGSPQLNTFGPNMSLAKDLLAKGQRTAVLEYFEACKRFWEMHDGRLDQWASQVRSGQEPQFGANLAF